MSNKSIRICIEKDQIIYKVTSLYLLSDGSFSIDIPYCSYTEALATKFEVDYSKREILVAIEDTEKFKACNRPKLTLHASGFVQLSGKGITSGIDKQSKMAKGVGVYSNPLINPIISGPTVGIQIWGIDKFQVSENLKTGDILITESDLIRKISNIHPINSKENVDLNSYSLEIFVFSKDYEKFIKEKNGKEEMTFRFPNYLNCPGAIFTFPVVRLTNHSSFLGILPFTLHIGYPDKKIDFGFIIGSPAGYNSPDKKGKRFNIQLLYPNIAPELTINSLDYNN